MANPTVTDKPLRAAIIGAGEWAQRYHFPALALLASERAVDISGVWNRTAETAEQVARQFSIDRVYRSFEEVLNDQHIDCFVVLVNSNVLAETVWRLLVRDLPIFTERPPRRYVPGGLGAVGMRHGSQSCRIQSTLYAH